MAESPSDTRAHINPVPSKPFVKKISTSCLNYITAAWDQLCPIFDSLSPSQLGGGGNSTWAQAANITTLLFPHSPLP